MKPTVIRQGKTVYECSEYLDRTVRRGAEYKTRLDAVKDELDLTNDQIADMVAEYLKTAQVTIAGDFGECTVKLNQKHVITPEGWERLKKILGPYRADDLVNISFTRTPSKKLVDMAKTDKQIYECLTVKTGRTSVSYR